MNSLPNAGCARSSSGRASDDLGVAGDLDLARPIAAVGDRQAAHFDVVLGRHGDLQLRLEIAVATSGT